MTALQGFFDDARLVTKVGSDDMQPEADYHVRDLRLRRLRDNSLVLRGSFGTEEVTGTCDDLCARTVEDACRARCPGKKCDECVENNVGRGLASSFLNQSILHVENGPYGHLVMEHCTSTSGTDFLLRLRAMNSSVPPPRLEENLAYEWMNPENVSQRAQYVVFFLLEQMPPKGEVLNVRFKPTRGYRPSHLVAFLQEACESESGEAAFAFRHQVIRVPWDAVDLGVDLHQICRP